MLRAAWLLLIPCVVLVLAGCASDKKAQNPYVGAGSIRVLADSGGEFAMNGTWAGCDGSGASDYRTIWTFEGTALHVTQFTYSTTDGSCSWGENPLGTFLVTVHDDGNATLSAWSDGSSAGLAPPIGGDGASLPDPPVATHLTIIDPADGSTIGTVSWFVDDHAAPAVLYMEKESPSLSCDIIAGGGWPACLDVGFTLTRQ